MAPKNDEHSSGGYGSSPHMKTVALSILVMGISIAIVIVIWAWFGYIGPKFSTQVMKEQQTTLRQQYGLPPTPPVSAEEAEVPPSERGLGAANGTSTASSTTTVNNTNSTISKTG